MFQLDLKRASLAIAASRLDDAFEVLTTSPDRTHRDAQKLIDQLTDRYIQRAQEHVDADRLADARHDADRAHVLAGNRLDVAEMREAIHTAAQQQSSKQQGRHQILQAVHQQAEAGRYSLGRQLLNDLSTSQLSQRGQQAAKEAEVMLSHRRQVMEDLVRQLNEAAKRETSEQLLNRISQLPTNQQNHEAIVTLRDTAIAAVCEQGQSAVKEGRIDRAVTVLETVRHWKHSASEELSRIVGCCSETNTAIASQDYATAETQLRILDQLVSAKWITTALKQVQTIVDQLKEFQAGPLGMLKQFDRTVLQTPATPSKQPGRSPQRSNPATQSSIGNVLQVDGIGSLLLQTQDVVTIGRASRTQPVDVELLTEGLAAPIVIRRTGEDYFVESAMPFRVNQRETQRHLLQNGDSIQLGHRGRLKFAQPVAASGSAVLTISGVKLKRQDIRHIVLLSDSILFGASGCHFKLPDMPTPILLHRSDAGFAVRELGAESQALTGAESVAVGSARFVLVEGYT